MRSLSTSMTTLALALCSLPAFAQGGSTAAAEALFQEGRALYQGGKFPEACPKLAESHRLDPATGTLLTLALCHEGEGKLASAWAEFNDVEGRAQREGRDDRAKLAREHANALRTRLSTLAVDVPAEVAQTPGLELSVDGVALGAGSFGMAVPVDGGEHRIEATAPGKAAWRNTISVKSESDAVRVSVPPLATAPVTAPVPVASRVSAPELVPATRDKGSRMRMSGLITAGTGVIALGVGGYLALDAKSDYEAAEEQCDGSVCGEGPYQASEDARSQGTLATIVFAAGGVALATGATLWLLAPSSEGTGHASVRPRVERIDVGAGRFVVRGTF